jgi:hypothetical protein
MFHLDQREHLPGNFVDAGFRTERILFGCVRFGGEAAFRTSRVICPWEDRGLVARILTRERQSVTYYWFVGNSDQTRTDEGK